MTLSDLKEQLKFSYQHGGMNELTDKANHYIQTLPNGHIIKYEHCEQCDCDVPSIEHECLACGQKTN